MHKRFSYALVHLFSCVLTVAQSQGGMTLPLIAVFLAALIGMTALMIDGSRLTVTSNEVQAGADIAATAGAMALFQNHLFLTDSANELSRRPVNSGLTVDTTLKAIEIGHWSRDGGFSPHRLPRNAVRAVVSKPINTLLIDSVDIGSTDSTVTKTAIAAFRGAGSGQTTLPLALGDCWFPENCYQGDCLPTIDSVPARERNVSWTGFFGPTEGSAIESFFHPSCGGSGKWSTVRVGDQIHLTGDELEPLLDRVECLITHGLREQVVPIVPCPVDNTRPQPVLGFATIVIDSVSSSGSEKGISLHAIFKADQPGTAEGGNYGSGAIALVQ